VADDVDVAALDRGGQVVGVVAAVPELELRACEHRVVTVDGPAVQGLALAGRLGHGVDRHAAVDPRRVVPLKQVVRQRGQDEVLVTQGILGQAVDANGEGRRGGDVCGVGLVGEPGVEIGFDDPADEVAGQDDAVDVVRQMAQRADGGGADHFGGAQPVQDVGPAVGDLEGFGQGGE
jgi:hypothetical protein